MKLSHLFIERPIFATVLSILITLIGGFAYFTLPVAQYPEIAPPTIVVNATYPGASAEVVADTVAAPLEQEINGVENMLYMSSQSTGDGRLVVTISFALGTDLDTAQVLVQNRVAVAEPPSTRASAMPNRCCACGVRVSFNSSLSCAIVSAWAGGAGGLAAFSSQPASRIGIRRKVWRIVTA